VRKGEEEWEMGGEEKRTEEKKGAWRKGGLPMEEGGDKGSWKARSQTGRGKREGGRDGWREERKKVAFHCRPRLIGIISPPQSERSDCR